MISTAEDTDIQGSNLGSTDQGFAETTFNEIIKRRKDRIRELVDYDHTKRPDINSIVDQIISDNVPDDFMETWKEYITNPVNESCYRYKFAVPLTPSIDNINGAINGTSEKELPSYEEIYYVDSSEDQESGDIYDMLILPQHKRDLEVYRLKDLYKSKIQDAILILMRNRLDTMIHLYDTFWLNIDGYYLRHKIKIRYSYIKDPLYKKFTGVIVTMKLKPLAQSIDINSDDGSDRRKKCIVQ